MITETIEMSTRITGMINGVEFSCEGSGTGWPTEGRSKSFLRFSNQIDGFVPLLCKSWKCNGHKPIAVPLPGYENPFAKYLDEGGNIFTQTSIKYPFKNDEIVATSLCKRMQPGKQIVVQTRVGVSTVSCFSSHFLRAIGSGQRKRIFGCIKRSRSSDSSNPSPTKVPRNAWS